MEKNELAIFSRLYMVIWLTDITHPEYAHPDITHLGRSPARHYPSVPINVE